MDEMMRQMIQMAQNTYNLANACQLLAHRATQQDSVIQGLQERVAMLEATQGINKAMLH